MAEEAGTRYPSEIYVSTDVEADGPIPGPHSMLSFASATCWPTRPCSGPSPPTRKPCPAPPRHPVQMQWWKTQPEAWATCRRDLERPEDVMPRYVEWWKALLPASRCSSPFRPVSISHWVFWYMMRYAGRSPLRLGGAGHQDTRLRADRAAVPQVRQAGFAGPLAATRCLAPISPWTMPSSRALCSATCWPSCAHGKRRWRGLHRQFASATLPTRNPAIADNCIHHADR